jgi:hypothetical protein
LLWNNISWFLWPDLRLFSQKNVKTALISILGPIFIHHESDLEERVDLEFQNLFVIHCVPFSFQRKKSEYTQRWEETSREVIGAFLKYFGTPIDLYNRGKRRITQALSPTNSPPVSEDDDDFIDHFDDDYDDMPGQPKRSRVMNDDTLPSDTQ